MPEFAHKYNIHMLLKLHFTINFNLLGNIHYIYYLNSAEKFRSEHSYNNKSGSKPIEA